MKTKIRQFKSLSKVFILLLTFYSSAYSGVFLNAFVQKAFNTRTTKLNYNLGYCIKSNKIPFSYYEFGLTAMPSFSDGILVSVSEATNKKTYTKSYYGTYGAGYAFIFPIFRPGIIVGGGFGQKEIWRGSTKSALQRSEISNYEFMPYFGIVAHIGMLSLAFTNLGFGGGINIQFN